LLAPGPSRLWTRRGYSTQGPINVRARYCI